MKLNKKYKYRFCLCPFCDTPNIGRKLTGAELKEYQDTFPDKESVSVWEQETTVVVIPCVCDRQPEMALSFSISFKRAKEIQKELLAY